MELSSSRRSLPQLETTSVGNTAQPQQMISFLDAHVESLLGQTLVKVKKNKKKKTKRKLEPEPVISGQSSYRWTFCQPSIMRGYFCWL